MSAPAKPNVSAVHTRHAELRAAGRQVGGRRRPPVLTPAQVQRLRQLIPCLGCGAVPMLAGQHVSTFHAGYCGVAGIPESGD